MGWYKLPQTPQNRIIRQQPRKLTFILIYPAGSPVGSSSGSLCHLWRSGSGNRKELEIGQLAENRLSNWTPGLLPTPYLGHRGALVRMGVHCQERWAQTPPGRTVNGAHRTENRSWDTLASFPSQQLSTLFVWKETRKVFKEFDQPTKPRLKRLTVEIPNYSIMKCSLSPPCSGPASRFLVPYSWGNENNQTSEGSLQYGREKPKK